MEDPFVEAVRNLRRGNLSFEEIERTLGKRITEAVACVREEEANQGSPKPSRGTGKKKKTKVTSAEPYVKPQSSGCGVLDRGPVLI